MARTKTCLQGIQFLVAFALATCCDPNQIAVCINSFNLALATAPISPEQRLNTVCDSIHPSFKSCLSPQISECDLQVRTAFEGVTNTYDYMCNEGREDTARYIGCLSKDSLTSELKTCETAFKSKLQSGTHAEKDTVCGYLDEFLDCATDVSEAECGSGAAEYQKKVVQFSLGPLLESIGCGEGGDVGNGRDDVTVGPIPLNIELNINFFSPNTQDDSGYAPVKAMMWIVAFGLLVQWFVL